MCWVSHLVCSSYHFQVLLEVKTESLDPANITLETSIKVVCLALFTTWSFPEWWEEALMAPAAVKVVLLLLHKYVLIYLCKKYYSKSNPILQNWGCIKHWCDNKPSNLCWKVLLDKYQLWRFQYSSAKIHIGSSRFGVCFVSFSAFCLFERGEPHGSIDLKIARGITDPVKFTHHVRRTDGQIWRV